MEEAVKLFCNWGAYVLGSNIKEMIKVAKIFNNHLKGVCNAMVESFSNAMAERLNGKIQEIKSVARGYRTFGSTAKIMELYFCIKIHYARIY